MQKLNVRMTSLSLAVAGVCGSIAIPALAQQTAAAPAPAASAAAAAAATSTIETVTVTGFRQSVENSLNMKRSADGFVDAISADALGRFPDLNVGEALTRIPGIQINRENGDRQATVNLRGLPGSFATVTLNGMAFADPAVGGSTPLGAFSSDVFTAFVVRKSPNAADKAGGLSGIIDLQIQGALARKDGASIKVSNEYNTLGSSHAPGVNVSANHHFSKTLAVYGALTFKKENFRRDTVQPNTFQQLGQGNATFVRSVAVPASPGQPALPAVGTGAAAVTNLAAFADYYRAPLAAGETLKPGEVVLNVPAANTLDGKAIVGTGLKSKNGVLFLNSQRQISRETKGELLSLASGVELKATSDLTLGANVFHTQREYTGTSDNLIDNFGQGSQLVTADPNSVFTTDLGLNYVNAFNYINGFYNTGRRKDNNVNKTTGISGTAKWNFNDWQSVTEVGLSKAKGEYDQLVLASQKNPGQITAANPVGNGTFGSVNMAYGDVRKFVVNYGGTPNTAPGGVLNVNGLTPTSPLGSNPLAVSGQDIQQIRGTTGDVLQLTGVYRLSENTVNSIQQTFERNLHDLPFSSIKGGLRYEQNKFKATAFVPSAWGANAAAVTPDLITTNGRVSSFFGGKSPGFSSYWPVIDIPYVEANLKPTEASLVPGQPLTPKGFPVLMTPGGWVNNPNHADYATGNFRNDYAIASAFVMGNFDTSVLGMPLRGNVGLRHETLKKTIDALERTIVTVGGVASPVFTTRSFESTYRKNLPSFMAALEPARDIVVRYAAYETYVAPQRRDENPVSSVSKNNGSASTNYGVTLGKKDLKPYTAFSQDLGIEWYNRKGSVVALNLYHKSLNGYTYGISNATDPDLTCPSSGIFNGQDYGTGPLRPFDPAAPGNTGCRAVNDDPNNLINGVPAPVYVTTTGSKNNPNKVKVTGLEISAQQNLSFLPEPWSNFGGLANYSLTKIDGKFPNGTKVLLNGVSEGNYNLIGFYETGKFGVRVIYNYREPYELPGGQTFTGGPKTAKARSQIDMSATYRFGNGMTISLDAFNLTDAMREDFDQDPRVLRLSDYDGRTYRVTLRASF